MIGKCHHCGEQVYLPYNCSYCGHTFCDKHRLPEKHNCTGLNTSRSWSKYKNRDQKKRVKTTKVSLAKENPDRDTYLWNQSDSSVYQDSTVKNKKSNSGRVILILIVVSLIVVFAYTSQAPDTPINEDNIQNPINEPDLPKDTSTETEEEDTQPISIPEESNIEVDYQKLVSYALELINIERYSRGLTNVTLSDVPSAQLHAEDMLNQEYYSHWSLDGRKPYMRYYDAGGIGVVSENIGYQWTSGYLDSKEAISSLTYSMMYDDSHANWGHRDNIIDPLHNKVSIGIAYDNSILYLVQNFEDDYLIELNMEIDGYEIQLSINCTKPHWKPYYCLVYYEPLPEPIDPDLIETSPYDGSYGMGTYIGAIVIKEYYMENGITVTPKTWVTMFSYHESSFNLKPMYDEYGSGVYTLQMIEENDVWNTICLYYSNE